MHKITPCLWFDFKAEEAVAHYTRIFRRSRVLQTMHYNDAIPSLSGQVATITFEVEGQPLIALNGGPNFHFTEAISLMVDCADQAEIDRLWEALGEGGSYNDCGWLKDKFGLSWQITPGALLRMMQDPDRSRASRVMAAMLTMQKLDLARLQAAYDGA